MLFSPSQALGPCPSLGPHLLPHSQFSPTSSVLLYFFHTYKRFINDPLRSVLHKKLFVVKKCKKVTFVCKKTSPQAKRHKSSLHVTSLHFFSLLCLFQLLWLLSIERQIQYTYTYPTTQHFPSLLFTSMSILTSLAI